MDTKKDYIAFLTSHIEWEHIELDCIDLVSSNNLRFLSLQQLRNLAYSYGY